MNAETVYLGLGGNLGNREDNLRKVREFITERLKIDKVSSVYETEPVSEIKQPRYLNMVVKTHTSLSPAGLLMLSVVVPVLPVKEQFWMMPSFSTATTAHTFAEA